MGSQYVDAVVNGGPAEFARVVAVLHAVSAQVVAVQWRVGGAVRLELAPGADLRRVVSVLERVVSVGMVTAHETPRTTYAVSRLAVAG